MLNLKYKTLGEELQLPVNWSNKEQVLSIMRNCLKIDGPLLKKTSNELKNDIDVVIEALNKNYFNFKYVSDNLKYNRYVYLTLKLNRVKYFDIYLRSTTDNSSYEVKKEIESVIKGKIEDPAFLIIHTFLKETYDPTDLIYSNNKIPSYVINYFEDLKTKYGINVSRVFNKLDLQTLIPTEVLTSKISEYLPPLSFIDTVSYSDDLGKTPLTIKIMTNIRDKLLQQGILVKDEVTNKLIKV